MVYASRIAAERPFPAALPTHFHTFHASPQNVCRAHPLTEPSVTSWLASEGDSASGDGRLACLSAIGHLIRQQEGECNPSTFRVLSMTSSDMASI